MVAKDYPFYLTVKRANCSLEAPLGSGVAKDEVGRALRTPAPPGFSATSPGVPLAFTPSPPRAALLRIAPSSVPSHAFSVGPLSLPFSLRRGTADP